MSDESVSLLESPPAISVQVGTPNNDTSSRSDRWHRLTPLIIGIALIGGFAFVGLNSRSANSRNVGQENPSTSNLKGKSQALSSSIPSTSSDDNLKVEAHRVGYPPVAKDARHLYGWDLIVDPHVSNVFKVTNPKSDEDSQTYSYTWSVKHIEGPSKDTFEPIELKEQESQIELQFPSASDRFSLTVTEYVAGTSTPVRVYETENLIAKYVRREIRKLSDADRNHYLDALEIMYTITQEEGQAKYGHNFVDHGHLGALHGSSLFLYHGNLAFMTAHPMFILKAEKSLLAINDQLALPYWDLFIDSELEGAWSKSVIYSEDWFGTVNNGPEDEFRIRGRFRNVKLAYDPDETIFPRAHHNPYGYLERSASKNPYLQRTSYNCGYYHEEGFASCENLVGCLDKFADGTFHGFRSLDTCIENQVHAALHSMHGGLWDCPVDFKDYLDEHSDWLSHGRMSFLAVNTVNCQETVQEEWLSCDNSCNIDDDDCTCTPDESAHIPDSEAIENIHEKHLYGLLESCLETFYTMQYRGKDYMEISDIGTFQWKDLTKEQNYEFNKLLLKTVVGTYHFGSFDGASSSLDPLFFLIHSIFDRATHLMRLSPSYNKGNFEWRPLNSAYGEGWLSKTPFDANLFEPYLGDHLFNKEGKLEKLTNKQIWAGLKPDGLSSPYVYDELRHFGSCVLMGQDEAVED